MLHQRAVQKVAPQKVEPQKVRLIISMQVLRPPELQREKLDL